MSKRHTAINISISDRYLLGLLAAASLLVGGCFSPSPGVEVGGEASSESGGGGSEDEAADVSDGAQECDDGADADDHGGDGPPEPIVGNAFV